MALRPRAARSFIPCLRNARVESPSTGNKISDFAWSLAYAKEWMQSRDFCALEWQVSVG